MAKIEQHYSVEAAAQILGGIHRGTLFNWIYQGKIQRVKVGGRTMISESELRRILNEGAGPKAVAKLAANQESAAVA